MHSPVSVVTRLDLRLVLTSGASLPVTATLTYEPRDPYAITVGFDTDGTQHGHGEEVQWTFARSLLEEGVTQRAGVGDVRVWPGQIAGAPITYLALSSPSGEALFELPLAELVEFLARSFAAVPSGSESALVDVDAAVGLLLSALPDN